MAHRRLKPFYVRLRFATSALSLWLLNLNVLGFSLKSVCSPGLNCHGCAWATGACPIGVMAFGSAMRTIPILAVGSVLAVGAVFGRLICSFVCPFGFFQDLLHKIPSPKFRVPRFFRYGKYLAMVLMVFLFPYALGFDVSGYLAVSKPVVNKNESNNIDVEIEVANGGTEPMTSPVVNLVYRAIDDGHEVYQLKKEFPDITVPPGETMKLPTIEVPNHLLDANLVVDSPQSEIRQRQSYTYYCTVCPAGTLTASIPSYFRAGSAPLVQRIREHWLRLSILLVFLAMMVLSSRPFCHLFCPLGACYAVTSKAALSRMTINPDACISCGLCDKSCPMDLNVRKEVGGLDCIACGDCMKVCPKNGIKRTFGI